MAYIRWKPYVPVAKRRQLARKKMAALSEKGVAIQPIEIEGRTIAKTFWGGAWCEHLESFSDYANRLPRGRTYVRNGSVCHLAVSKGRIEAKVSGSELYEVGVQIKTLPAKKWSGVKGRCAGQIGSLLELMQGNLSDHVMAVVTDRRAGLFPMPAEISFDCNCPDWASMCKHVAAVLYGVGARLDEKPQLLFDLRGVDHEDLIDTDAQAAVSAATRKGKSKRIATDDLSDVFGIEIGEGDGPADTATPGTNGKKTRTKKKTRTLTKKRAAKRAVKVRVRASTTAVKSTGRAKKKKKKKSSRKVTKKATTAKRATVTA